MTAEEYRALLRYWILVMSRLNEMPDIGIIIMLI